MSEARLTIEEAAAQMNVAQQWLRLWIQEGTCPFGKGIKRKRWAYYINAERFKRYMSGQA